VQPSTTWQHELLPLLLHVAQIHGIWFYDESDLQRLSSLLHKILNQLPKPDAADPATKAQVVPLQVNHFFLGDVAT
jgi:hypothetical protein